MQVNKPISPILAKQLNLVLEYPKQEAAQTSSAQTGYENSQESANAMRNNVLGQSNVRPISPMLKRQLGLSFQYPQYEVDSSKVVSATQNQRVQGYENNLKSMFTNNEANIMAVIMRTFNAKDTDGNCLIQGNEESGNFINAVERLDELKALGINTLHILPFHPPGKSEAMGTAGSLYAPDDFLKIDPVLRDPNDPRSIEEQCKYFIDECHKRGIKVMLDLPSCASVDFARRHPELMAKEKDGSDKTPQGWRDIRMFRIWDDESNKILNPHLLDLHKKYVDMCVDLGFDGIRADVARAKSMEFWNVIIPYSRSKDPEFAWLAETYTYEDASPQLNMPHDRPFDQLKAGFDAYYGQYHIYDQWLKADDLHNYVKENIQMSNTQEVPKSLIGSFATHDDVSPMFYGGAPWVMLTTGLQAFLPQVNPYFVDGVQTGDYYLYPYDHAINSTTMTDNKECTVHKGRIDIFNLSRKPGGDFPEINNFITQALKVRNSEEYNEVITKGSYIPLQTTNPEIVAFARHEKGKTLLVIANRNVNFRTSGHIAIPGLNNNQPLNNLVPAYGQESFFQKENNKLTVDLAPSRVQVFEIDTPNIEAQSPEVYRQSFVKTQTTNNPQNAA